MVVKLKLDSLYTLFDDKYMVWYYLKLNANFIRKLFQCGAKIYLCQEKR